MTLVSYDCMQICAIECLISIRNYSMYQVSCLPRSSCSMKRLVLFAITSLMLAGTSAAQGIQTGTIRGMVKDQQERAVPGATITATSAALLGPRSTVTDGQGRYSIPSLPPGSYRVSFELSGFATVTRTTVVPLGLTVEEEV